MRVRLISLAALACLVALPASAQKVNGVDPRVIDAIYERSKPFAYANQIATSCRSIRLKRGAKRSMDKWLSAQRRKHGLSENRLRKELSKLPKKRVQDDAFAFVQSNNIVVTDRETYCAAGKKLIASGSDIGAFLVER